MQLNKSVRLYFLISVWKNIWLTSSHRVKPCVVCFQISYLDWWIVAMKCIFSPLCVSKCVFRCTGWLNVLSHCTHLWFFSLLWMSRCLFKFKTLLNDLLQSEQRCIFTPASESSDLQLEWMICCILSICVTSLQCESTYGWPVGWNIWMTWHTCCKDVSLLCPRSDLFSFYCLLKMTEESLFPLFIWSVRPLKKVYHVPSSSWQCCC